MGPSDLQRDHGIADRLPRSWDPFFARFGRLTPVQREAIPPILLGKDVLVCSPTASGKTEAVCAPLLERLLSRSGPWTILYISPTRALVNDLHARLLAPVGRLGLRLVRRTGDHRDALAQVPHVLLTTPESFDSLLCRGRQHQPEGHVLSHVAAVVLDEIHLLDGTSRGEQVRWLLERLRRLRGHAVQQGWSSASQFQTVALSATVAAPTDVAGAYLGAQRMIIEVPGSRPIDTVSAPCASPGVEDAVLAHLDGLSRPEKVLVFCNARHRVDDLVVTLRAQLGALNYTVRAHHGSLSQAEREGTEAAVRRESRIVVVATSTLELGIDIGDIDLVVLDGPPPDTSSLLQRIGRGNRRSESTRVMACSGSLAETLIHAAMIEAARDGWLGPIETGPQYAVARQQVASYIFQFSRRDRDRDPLQQFVDACAPPVVAEALLDTMLANGELMEESHRVRLAQPWLEKAQRGDIHSNIEASPGETVVDERTGGAIVHNVRFRGGTGLRTAGELLHVRKWTQYRIEVRRVTDEQLARGEWSYTSRAWVKGAGQPQAVRRYLGIREDEWPVILENEWLYVFHFGGARCRAVLELAASHASSTESKARINEWSLAFPMDPVTRAMLKRSLEETGEPPAEAVPKLPWLLRISPAMLDLTIANRLDRLEHTLGRPFANKALPFGARLDEVRQWLQLNQQVERLGASRWQWVRDPNVRWALSILKNDL